MIAFVTFIDRCLQYYDKNRGTPQGLIKLYSAWLLAREMNRSMKRPIPTSQEVIKREQLLRMLYQGMSKKLNTDKLKVGISHYLDQDIPFIHELISNLRSEEEFINRLDTIDYYYYPGTIGTEVKDKW